MAELESRFSVEAVAEAEKRRLAKEAGEYEKQPLEKTIGNWDGNDGNGIHVSKCPACIS